MGLMGVSESIETGVEHLLYTSLHLFTTKSMALPQKMFILASAVQKHRLTVQKETPVAIVALHRPADGANTEGGFQCIFFLSSLL